MGMDPNQNQGEYPPPPGSYPPPGNYPPPGGYGPPGGGYPPPPGYGAPMGNFGGSPPVPAGIGNIFQKWINVTTKPGAQSFANELPTANWGDVWITVLVLGVVTAIAGYIRSLYLRGTLASYFATLPADQRAAMNRFLTNSSSGLSWGAIVSVPVGFFIGMGILFLVAKMFGGSGSFLQQAYAFSLFYVPIQLVSAIVGLVPILGGLVSFVLGIYSIVLAVFAVSASQRLSTGKSVAVVLLPAVVVLLLFCGLIFLIIALIVGATHGITS